MNYKNLAVAGEGLSQKCREGLARLGFEVIILPSYGRLGRGIAAHADLMLLPLDDKIFIYRELSESLPSFTGMLRRRGYGIIEVDTLPSEKYPQDIALNCLRVGEYIFCKQKHTAKEVLEYVRESGYTLLNVNQGYTRCCACPVGDRGLVSADPSILAAAIGAGVETLAVDAGHVVLDGYDYGFIGGACGAFNGSLYFAGDLSSHPDCERIESFCAALGIEAVSLSDEPLKDVGSIFFFD